MIESTVPATLEPIDSRYAIGKLIGTGGMAAVYQATELASGREVALKQFTLSREDRHYQESASLFEQEFLTLAQLSHPRIIEVYDYAVSDAGPYYTMELLDGGDLRERTPMEWREACGIAYDVCSSLALVHSRRLVHRDVSPRNIRCTRDGKAKLFDFGALVPMGPGDIIVGTPQFVAPEVVHRSALDARTDLFSLGATLYFALTGRAPYPVKGFQELRAAWERKPTAPSSLVPGIPAALDSLVLSLISTEPASRPHSAFEVMQHLAAIADLERVEPARVSRAYLSTPTMVGRDGLMTTLQREIGRALGRRSRAVLIQAAAGAGRSRLLDATALAAKAQGMLVLRAHGGAAGKQGFKAAGSLVEHLVAAAPEVTLAAARAANVEGLFFDGEQEAHPAKLGGSRLTVRDLTTLETPRVALQDALGRWFLAVTELTPLTIAVDDIHRIDEPSLAFLAALASQANHNRLFLVTTAELGADPTDGIAFDVLRQNSARFSLRSLDNAEVRQLFVSVFGDVPNVRLVTERVHAVAQGNPRACLDLAQHLVDQGLVRYEGGAWTLPARLDPSDLPASIDAALRARIAALSPLARFFAQSHALATHPNFSRDDYTRLRRDATARERDAAIGELVSSQLVASDGRAYTIANESCHDALFSSLDAPEAIERHRALIDVYAGQLPFGVVRHALAAGLETRGLDELAPSIAEQPESTTLTGTADVSPAMLAETFSKALAAAERLARPAREISELQRWVASLGILADSHYFEDTAPAWRARLELDSGYADYQSRPDIADRSERLSNAMRLVYERHFATPEGERVYRPDEAIAHLVRYVAMSIAYSSSRLDIGLMESLPELLEPFAPVNELVDIVWKNAVAAREAMCRVRPERARELWMDVYERLGTITGVEARYVSLIRNAVCLGVGVCEAWMGMPSATTWAERLEDDPLQRVSALQLRRTVRIQLGDWEGAERLRKQAEIAALQSRSRQMFLNVLQVEVNAFSMAGDMTALKHAIDRARAQALNAPKWTPTVLVAEARFQVLCSNFEAALSGAENALAHLESPDGPVYPLGTLWCGAIATRLEALIGLERHEDAKRIGTHAIESCKRLGIGAPSHDISRTLALAEGKLGEFDRAAARLSEIIEEQLALGISGLRLGASYEARARIAVWASDPSLAETYMRHTAREYRYGHGSALGARYERLVQEAARLGGAKPPSLSEFDSAHGTSNPTSATAVVTQAMKGAGGITERAERALDLLCDERAATGGALYLFQARTPRLLANRGARAPSPELAEFMQRFLASELPRDRAETRIVSEPQEERALAANYHTETLGLRYYPCFLCAGSAEEARYAGVVAFAYPGDPPMVDDKLLVAVSTHLIEAGDCDALEYGDWHAEVQELRTPADRG
jgi:hypothetical protein